MNKSLQVLLSVLFASSALAQNLVPNANFALYNSCPTGVGQLDKCQSWYQPSLGTTDYFNACHDALAGSPHYVGVPDNVSGTQASASNAYLGMVTLSHATANGREYAGTVLPALMPGAAYRVLLKLSLADQLFTATEAPGVFFFKSRDTFSAMLTVLPYTPQIEFEHAGIITDKTNWVTVIDTFIADSAYTHMVIGNFRNDALTPRTTLPGSSINTCLFYIDSVSVEKIADPMAVVHASAAVRARLWPNPVTDKVVLQAEGLPLHREFVWSIINMQGQVVRTVRNVGNGQTAFSCEDLPAGFYLCKLHGDDGMVWQHRMTVYRQ